MLKTMLVAALGIGAANACMAVGSMVEPYSCRNGLFAREQSGLRDASIIGAKNEKIRLFSDDEGCPHGGTKCLQKAYIIPGDDVLVAKSSGNWSCIWFSGKKRETVGWVDTTHLRHAPPAPPAKPGQWIGRWTFYDNVIVISGDGKRLLVKGDASWQGHTLPDGSINVHAGSLEGTLAIRGNQASVGKASDCHATLTLLSTTLVVTDNGNCGGMNVRFDGVYRKSASAAKR